MTNAQIFRAITITMLAGVSATLNYLHFVSFGYVLATIGLALQFLGLAAATTFQEASNVGKWCAAGLIAICIGVSTYSANGVLTQALVNRDNVQVNHLNHSIEAIDAQILALAEKGVVTNALPLREERAALVAERAEVQTTPVAFQVVSVAIGLVIDLGAIYLASMMGGTVRVSRSAPAATTTASVTVRTVEHQEPVQEVLTASREPQQLELHPVNELDQDTQILALLAQGASQRKVAALVGVSQSTVSRIKKRQGV